MEVIPLSYNESLHVCETLMDHLARVAISTYPEEERDAVISRAINRAKEHIGINEDGFDTKDFGRIGDVIVYTSILVRLLRMGFDSHLHLNANKGVN